MTQAPYALRWCRALRHGTCAAVALPDPEEPDGELPGLLTEAERSHALSLGTRRRITWVGGRVALRHAARRAGVELPTVESTPRGAPHLPPGLVGSIAHKSRLAVALLDRTEACRVGIDLEELDRPRPKIAKLVLQPEERQAVEALPVGDRWQAIVLRFSIKECIFKALDPYLGRYIGFREARVEPRSDGTAVIHLTLANDDGPFQLDAFWMITDGHVLATVRARP